MANEEMLKAWSNKFLEEIERVNNEDNTRNNKLGKIGERFVEDGIKFSLAGRGYVFDPSLTNDNTFDILPYFGADENNVGGIDFYVKVKHGGKIYEFLVEVKNWASYKNISDDIFDKEILDRFKERDPNHEMFWVLAMNKRNVPLISGRCDEVGIYIVPLEEHLTTTDYINAGNLQHTMRKFSNGFSGLLELLM